jgi:Zn-dependent protease
LIILSYLDLLQVSSSLFVAFFGSVVAALLIGITIHEFSHVLAAYLLGDPTGKNLGRLTLDPRAHIDPLGAVLILIIGFGWGRPAPVNPFRLSVGPKTGSALTAGAGPLSNLIVAAAAGLPIHAGLVTAHTPFVLWRIAPNWSGGDYLGLFLSTLVIFNIILALFNLLPVAPLDGFKVAVGLLPDGLSQALASTEQYGIGILALLFLLPWVTGGEYGIFTVLEPLLNHLTPLFTGITGGIPV